MSNDNLDPTLCQQVDDAMATLLDGDGPEALAEHLAECDRCRDARHEAERAREIAADSGVDYEHPEDMEARLEASLEARQSGQASAEVRPPSTMAAVTDGPHRTADVGPLDIQPMDEPPTRRVPKRAAQGSPLAVWLRKPRNTAIAGVVAAAAVAATVALVMSPGGGIDSGAATAQAPWSGKVVKVSRAAGGQGGLQICSVSGDSCTPADAGATIGAGVQLRTDDRTRAYVELGDGSRVALDRSTKLVLDADSDRRARLESGAIVAQVNKIEGSTARVDLPRGHVEVLGTKFALRTMGKAASVDVSRGSVLLVDEGERSVKVHPGEEGRSYPGVPPYATSAPRLGDAMSWSESNEEEEIAVRGLGELRAQKPGQKEERKGAVTLTSHKVKVRIVDGFARTEIDEVFTNNSDDVLEGIYRFPLPPDAQIERLALEVDGAFEEGAFVDRDRAAAIWRGAIVNAGGKRRQREEIVWVAGPWKDPALLEWQRGGRFELRIFPIPKKGSRRVVLTYTQVVKAVAGVRRYVYPLAHDEGGSLRVDNFDVNLQVRGHDQAFGVTTAGYEMQHGGGGNAETLTLSRSQFVPTGDLVVEYAGQDRNAELSAWAFQPTAATAVAATPKSATIKPDGKLAKSGESNNTDSTLSATNVADDAPFVALSLRPKLPRRTTDAQRSFVLVVDSSRSMFGERFKRASALATRVVSELDRLDRFALLACDTTCRALPGGLKAPSFEAAADVKQFLAGVTPEGGSDPAAAIRDAASAGSQQGRALRVVYIGDGTPTVGPIRPADLTVAAGEAVPSGRGTVTTVAIGADADLEALGALARGGAGVVLPYVPGQKTSEAAYAILGAGYGLGLSDVRVELPDGLVEVAPAQLDTIAAGSEAVVTARMTRPSVNGTVVLRGKVGDQAFEQRYPLDVSATSAAGNAFVPRLYAAARITDLEREGSASAREQAVKLSGRYNVASRYTSLLVLESAAMFRAFGLNNTRTVATWTGEEGAFATRTAGEDEVDETAADDKDGDDFFADKEEKSKSADLRNPFGGGGKGRGGGGLRPGSGSGFTPDSLGGSAGPMAQPTTATPARRPPSPAPRPKMDPQDPFGSSASRGSRAKKKPAEVARDPFSERERDRRDWNRRRRMVPMRRIFERKATISTTTLIPLVAAQDKIAAAENALAQNENRRDAVKNLYTLLALSGQLDRASQLAERWSTKEALDPEALTARADLAARRGQRDDAIRILGSVVDVRPGDVASQKRLARLHRWAGREALGCRHAIAIAQLRQKDAQLLADAVFCGRKTGQNRLVQGMLASADDKTRKAADALLTNMKDKTGVSGDIRLEAKWEGGADLDLALIHPKGHRVSWLGAPTRALISAEDVTSTSREALGLLGGRSGEYVVEVVRASGEGPVSGTLTIRASGDTRTVPFRLEGDRLSVGTVRVRFESRLVPL